MDVPLLDGLMWMEFQQSLQADLVTEINDTSLQYVMYPPPAGTEEGGKMVLPTS